MSDDIVTGGVLPIDDTVSDDGEFDPDAVESDDILDDEGALSSALLKNADEDEEDYFPEEE